MRSGDETSGRIGRKGLTRLRNRTRDKEVDKYVKFEGKKCTHTRSWLQLQGREGCVYTEKREWRDCICVVTLVWTRQTDVALIQITPNSFIS